MNRVLPLLVVLLLSGCALVATPAGSGVTGAALGLAASAFDFDTEVLKFWNDQHPAGQKKDETP